MSWFVCNRCGQIERSSAQCGMCGWGDLYPYDAAGRVRSDLSAPGTVKEWMERARARGHDAFGIANDPEAAETFKRLRRKAFWRGFRDGITLGPLRRWLFGGKQ